MFVKFTRKLMGTETEVVVNSDQVIWAQSTDAAFWTLLKMSDGPDVIVKGNLSEVWTVLKGEML